MSPVELRPTPPPKPAAAVAVLDPPLHGQSDRTNRVRDFAGGRLDPRTRRLAPHVDFQSGNVFLRLAAWIAPSRRADRVR